MRSVGFTVLLALVLTVGPRRVSAQWTAVGVSPDGQAIAAGGARGRISLWDARTGIRHHELSCARAVLGLSFVRDARTLAAGTEEGGVEIWRAGPAGFTRSGRLEGDQTVLAVAVSADGKLFAASGYSGWTHIYETTAWQQVGVIFERSNLTSGVSFARDGSFLATAGNTFSTWEIGPSSALWRPRGDRSFDDVERATRQSLRWARVPDREVDDEVYCADVAISPDGSRVVGVNGTSRHHAGGKRLITWDAATGRAIWVARSSGLLCVAFTADGERIATGSADGTVRIWESRTGKRIHEVKSHAKAVRNLAAVPGEAAFVSASEDGAAILWDSRTATPLREFRERD